MHMHIQNKPEVLPFNSLPLLTPTFISLQTIKDKQELLGHPKYSSEHKICIQCPRVRVKTVREAFINILLSFA